MRPNIDPFGLSADPELVASTIHVGRLFFERQTDPEKRRQALEDWRAAHKAALALGVHVSSEDTPP